MGTNTDLLLINSFTGGVNMPTTEQAENNYVARAVVDGDGNVNIEYVPAATAYAADEDVAATLAPLLRGPGLTVTSDDTLAVRRRPRYVQLEDRFMSGNATTGSIGQLGWNLLGSGTPAFSRAAPAGLASAARGELATSAGANDRSVLSLALTESGGVCDISDVNILQCLWKFDSVLTSKRAFFGFNDDMSQEPSAASACLGIYYDSAVSPNYQIIARNGSAGSPTVTLSAVPADTAQLITMYQATAGVWQFYVGGTLVGSISSGLPTPTMNIGWRLETLAAASKTLHIGYFGMDATAEGALDDDAFLEV